MSTKRKPKPKPKQYPVLMTSFQMGILTAYILKMDPDLRARMTDVLEQFENYYEEWRMQES